MTRENRQKDAAWLWAMLAVLAIALSCGGCGFLQREKQASFIYIISEPKYQPKVSITKELLAPVRDLTSLPRNAMGTAVLGDAVAAAGNAKIKIGRTILPVDRDHAYLIEILEQGFRIQAVPTDSVAGPLVGGPMLTPSQEKPE